MARRGRDFQEGILKTGLLFNNMQKLFESWRGFVDKSNDLEKEEPEAADKKAIRVLIFGHSQAGPYAVGGAQRKRLIAEGVPKKNVKRIARGGKNDKALAGLIKKDGKGDWTHVILHLDGNHYSAPGCSRRQIKKGQCPVSGPVRYEASKKSIVNYVIGTMGVPEENILIFTPPVNSEYGKTRLFNNASKTAYKAREISHLRSIEIFRSAFPKATVPDLIYAPDSAFSDALHMRRSRANEAADIAAAFISDAK